MLLGVRGVVLDDERRVFLVRHSYWAGWHFPGGGVEVGETLVEALARELREEGNIVVDAAPVLHGMFFNRRVGNRDHVAVYVVPRFHVTGPRAPDREIVASGFFPSDRLPEGTVRPVRDRLVEIFDAAPPSQTW